MIVLANNIHQHISNNGVPSPAMTIQQQFNFPPHPVSSLSQSRHKTHHHQQQHQQQQLLHSHHNQHQQHLNTISNFKIEPKTEHEEMPTDLSLSSNDRRCLNVMGDGITSETYP